MQQRAMMIVSAGEMQIPAILTARDMGFFVIATDQNPDAKGLPLADHPIVMDTKDADGHVRFAVANRDRFNIAGAFSGADNAVTVSAIAGALGLPGIPMDVALASNNKAMMKKRWLADGVPTPGSIEVRTLEEARQALERIGLPAMIKAIDNAASRGSRQITSEAQLPDALEDAKRNSTTRTALVEEWVSGDEQSVETIVYNSEHYRFGMVDRHFGFIPYAIETGHTNPSVLPDNVQDRIFEVVRQAAVSLGITWGPAKADMILTPKGPMVLEMPARLSGGWHSQYTTPLAFGLDPIRIVLGLASGGSMSAVDTVAPWRRVSVCKAIFPPPGRVTRISGVDEAKAQPGVDQIIMVAKEGGVIREYKNCADRPCYIITVGDTHEEAQRRWERAAGTVNIATTPL